MLNMYTGSAKPKINEIVTLRAIAIVLVVFGHSIILYSSSWNLFQSGNQVPILDMLKQWINLIQMPLFLSVSGFLFQASYKKHNIYTLLKQKSLRLLIPYIFFYFVWLLPIRSFLNFGQYDKLSLKLIFSGFLLGKDNGHLWYLPCLFLCFCVAYFIFPIVDNNSNYIALNIIVFGMIFLAISVVSKHFGFFVFFKPFEDLLEQFIWFYLGFVIRLFYRQLRSLRSHIGLMWFVFLITSIVGCVVESKFSVIFSMIILVILYIVVPPTKAPSIINEVSVDSFGIYLFHSPLVYITFTLAADINPLYIVLINFTKP